MYFSEMTGTDAPESNRTLAIFSWLLKCSIMSMIGIFTILGFGRFLSEIINFFLATSMMLSSSPSSCADLLVTRNPEIPAQIARSSFAGEVDLTENPPDPPSLRPYPALLPIPSLGLML